METIIFFIIVNALLVLWRERKKIIAGLQYHEGISLERCGSLAYPGGAASSYEGVVDSDPNHARAHFRLGIMYNINGCYDSGRRELEKAFELAPQLKTVASIVDAAQYAKKYLIDVTQRFPKDAQAWHSLAMFYYAMGDATQAQKAVEKWKGCKLEYVVEKYSIRISMQETQVARDVFDHIIIKLYPEYATYMYALTSDAAAVSRVAINVGDLDFADNILKNGLERNLRDAGIWTCYKNLIKKLDGTKKDRYAAFFKKIVERDRDNLGAWQCMGELLADLGKYYEVQECNAHIRRLDPASDIRSIKSPEEVAREREEAERKMEEERRKEAEEAMNELLEIAFNEDGSYSMRDMMEACRGLLTGDTEAAARHRLGMLYYECGRYYSAKVELMEAAKLDYSLREDEVILQLNDIIDELGQITPKQFVPKASIADYGVDPSYLEGGKVVDVFRINGLRAISVKFERRAGDDSPMFYRYQTFLYKADAVKPSCVVRLEISGFDTCCITRTDLETMMRDNFGAGHEDMAYEEFKYQVVAIMREMRPPMMTSQPDEPDGWIKEK